MKTVAIGTKDVVTVAPSAPVADVARQMKEQGVGAVVVAFDEKPVGIVTDRDLVLRVLDDGRDPRRTEIQEVMSAPVFTLPESASAQEAAASMREHQVRRLPVVDSDGRLAGIVTLDDLLHHVGRMNAEIAEAIASFPVSHFGG
jgi:CBS domain-containing protein